MKIIITEEQLRLIVEGESNESILIVGDSHTVDVGWTWSSLMKKSFKDVTPILLNLTLLVKNMSTNLGDFWFIPFWVNVVCMIIQSLIYCF